MPRWIVILVVSRDILIIGGVMLAWFLGKPMRVKPVLVSKLNTVAQIVFACLVLGELSFQLEFEWLQGFIMACCVLVLTLCVSVGSLYVRRMKGAAHERRRAGAVTVRRNTLWVISNRTGS